MLNQTCIPVINHIYLVMMFLIFFLLIVGFNLLILCQVIVKLPDIFSFNLVNFAIRFLKALLLGAYVFMIAIDN